MENNEENRHEKIRSTNEATSSIMGASIGGIVSSVITGSGAIAGPLGLIIGTVAGAVISQSVEDFSKRILSKREEKRIDTVVNYARDEIESLLKQGQSLRTDDFFTVNPENFSDASEILEGILLKAKNEYQNKKIKFLGYFFARLAFTDNISSESANHLLKIAEYLSYRQFCYLALLDRVGNLDVEPLRNRDHNTNNLQLEFLKQEEMNLHDSNDFGGFGLITGDYSGYGFVDYLSDTGKIFCELFKLSSIPINDLDELVNLLLECEKSLPQPPALPDHTKNYIHTKFSEVKPILERDQN